MVLQKFSAMVVFGITIFVWLITYASSGYVGLNQCDIRPLSSEYYVKAFSEKESLVAGCDSNNFTNNNQQIHVILLLDDAPVSIVPLSIEPHENSEPFDAQVVFVLASKHPVLWYIKADDFSNGSRFIFVLSNGSRLRRRPNVSNRVRKETLPSRRQQLLDYVAKKRQAITSFAEIQNATRIVKLLTRQRDTSLGDSCEVRENYRSPSLHSYYEKQQELNGCIARRNEAISNRYVHVIEINGPSHLHSKEVKLEVTARNWTRGPFLLVLVLKSHDEMVYFNVTTSQIPGRLDIITDRRVESSGVLMDPFRMAVERLASKTGLDLLDWVASTYGRPVSYSSLDVTDRIVLTVDGGDTLPQYPVNWRENLNRAMSVKCYSSSFTVSLQKQQLQHAGLAFSHGTSVSLLDRSCILVDNRTHFVFSAAAGDCGGKTDIVHDGRMQIYSNKVIIRREMNVDDDWVMSGSGVGLDESTLEDDEDYHRDVNPVAVNLSFSCQFPVYTVPDEIQLTMELYSKEDFVSPYRNSPIQINDGEVVYVQAQVTGDSGLQVMPSNCWLQPSVSHGYNQQHQIISNGCTADESTEILTLQRNGVTGIRGTPGRFSFKLNNYWDGVLNVDLACDLIVCSQNRRGSEPPACLDPDQFCLLQNLQHQEWPTAWRQTKFIRDLVLIKPQTVKNLSTPSTPPCETVMKVEGLDSGTVVGIAFAAFIIGVLLTGALWYIHTHTGPIVKRGHRPRSAETSGESTPSSTAPITIHHIHHH